jgi:probable DNA metabolism protein
MVEANHKRTEVSVLFDGTFDGFLCVVHAFYYEKIYPLHIQSEDMYQQTLDAEPYYIATDETKAAAVLKSIRKKISDDAAHRLYYASLAGESTELSTDMYMDMLAYVVLGFKMGKKTDTYLQHDAVLRVHSLSRQVGRETHLLSGFCRFAETKQGVYYCVITPKNYVLAPLAEHFRDRFMTQPWIIHDKRHNLAAVYNGESYVIADVPGGAKVSLSDREEQIQDMWALFFATIAIKERSGYKRQRQVLPLYFRGNMTEFLRKVST